MMVFTKTSDGTTYTCTQTVAVQRDNDADDIPDQIDTDDDNDGSLDITEANFGTDHLMKETTLVVKLKKVELAKDYLGKVANSWGAFKIYGSDLLIKDSEYWSSITTENLVAALIYPYSGTSTSFKFKVLTRDYNDYSVFGWSWKDSWTTIYDQTVIIAPGDVGNEKTITDGDGNKRTFVFTHAPLYNYEDYKLFDIIPMDYTHKDQNDENFVKWIKDDLPNIEAVFTGHTHGTNEAYTIDIDDNDVLSRSEPLPQQSLYYSYGTVYIETLTSTWVVQS